MSISRRQVLERLAMASAGLTVARFLGPLSDRTIASPRRAVAGNPLRLPPDFVGQELEAKVVTTNVWMDTPTTVWTLGGSYPAPTIRVRRGDELSVRLLNRLSEPTIIHWHGLLTPAAMDGHPNDAVSPGESKDYRFRITQPAGTFWYHPHPHELTAKQAYMGMAGFFIVEDDAEASLGLPSGGFDIPLVIQDRRVGLSRQFNYNPSMMDQMMGFLGDTILVNGTPEPYLEVSRDLYRLRLLNGSNARILKIGFDDGSPFRLIASDGGLLDRPYQVTSLWLGPGERVDVLADFSEREIGSSLILRTLPYGGAADAFMQGWGMDLLRFDVARSAERQASIPDTLSALEQLDPLQAERTRTFSLDMIHGMSMVHVINRKAYDMGRIDQRVETGSMELWEFVSTTDEPHPMHIHGAQFQVVSRNGSTELRAEDRGWKDTVIVDPMQTLRVAVRFGPEPGVFVAHCHNLEHEDTGMMMNVAIDSSAGGVDGDANAETAIRTIQPNPASGEVVISILLSRPDDLTLRCYSVDGGLAAQVAAGRYAAGHHDIRFDVGSLPSGRYYVELETRSTRYHRLLTVVR